MSYSKYSEESSFLLENDSFQLPKSRFLVQFQKALEYPRHLHRLMDMTQDLRETHDLLKYLLATRQDMTAV